LVKIIDYKNNQYHKVRHSEYLESNDLYSAWSDYAAYTYFRDVLPGEYILEFGGGLGNNLARIAKKAEVWMVEPSEIGCSKALQTGIKVAADLNDIPIKEFDYILCRHVLEHLDNPLSILRDLLGRLRKNGVFILILPVEKIDLAPIKEEIDYHLYAWNPRTVSNLLQRAGFQMLQYKYNYYTGRRILMPIYHSIGLKAYAFGMQILGRLFHARELIVLAKRRDA
jgi:ubiquinone/menaquinone biosynthesis C-methylase UbiE